MPVFTWDALNDTASTKTNQPVRIDVLKNDVLQTTGNTITVRVSGDQYKGTDADPYPRFRLLLDGKQVGDTAVVTANYKTGSWQDITFNADGLAASKGQISVQFFNDAWGGSSSVDRNLHIDSIWVNQTAFKPAVPHLYSNGSSTIDVASKLSSLASTVKTSSTVSIVDGPSNGTLVLNSDKTVTYTPKAGFSGNDVFTYKVADGAGHNDQASVAVSVTPAAVSDGTAYKTQMYTAKTSGYSESYGGKTYFIDPAAGASTNNGSSEGSAWKSYADAQRYSETVGFRPGDSILFKRGYTYDTKTGFLINADGTVDKPIVIGAYGNGATPLLTNSNFTPDASGKDTSIWDTVLNVHQDASYITIRDLALGSNTAGNIFETGIRVRGSHVTIDNVEISKAGQGIVFGGTTTGSAHGLVEHSYIHDLTMVRNTIGGDDDYGAIGVHVSGTSDVAIRDNTFKNIIASSYDYGSDGSVMEIYGNVRNVAFEGNYVENVLCVTEFGGQINNAVANVKMDHNVIVNADGIAYFHNGNSQYTLGSIANVNFTNNTVFSNVNKTDSKSAAFGFGGSDGSFLNVQNNIFAINSVDMWDFGATNYRHANNLYDYSNIPFRTGYFASATEYKGDAAFVNETARNFQLTSASDALNKAVPIAGSLTDFMGHELTGRINLDMGALEFWG